MTFEYRDPDGGLLRVRPLPGISAVLVETGPQGCAVPAGLMPDVVDGARDAARTAAHQTTPHACTNCDGIDPASCLTNPGRAVRPTTGQATCGAALCGSRSLPISTGEVVRCVLHTGHAGQCQSAVEHPYVSWPNPSHGVWNTDADVLMGEMSARAMNRLFPARAAQAQAAKEKERAAHRAAAFNEAADLIEQLQTQLDGEIRAEYGELDRDTEVEGAATRRMAAMLRQTAAEARR